MTAPASASFYLFLLFVAVLFAAFILWLILSSCLGASIRDPVPFQQQRPNRYRTLERYVPIMRTDSQDSAQETLELQIR
ncbi:hypothetical protein [Phaffia rhodozyma]|uniref:Uncharacterized protein n=1 Tax=Phaffia rhodozyma TaxID=264483 RepID=A0A0F7SMG6_PHARH|nr:hypothetical protein [Phaffia rhodozyma]